MSPILILVVPGRGKFPDDEPPGYRLDAARQRQAGEPLADGWRAVPAGVQGDQEFMHKLFRFKRAKA